MAKDRPAFLPEIAALGVHICQKMGYDWIARHMCLSKVGGLRVFDFGPNGYPFTPMLAKMGARVSWVDRDPACAAAMARYGVKMAEISVDEEWPTADVIVASNAIQHNKTGADDIYRRLRDVIAPARGRLYVVEAVAQKTSWWGNRDDPHWIRTLEEHEGLWAEAGLSRTAHDFFTYTYDTDRAQETARWTAAPDAARVVACLRPTDS